MAFGLISNSLEFGGIEGGVVDLFPHAGRTMFVSTESKRRCVWRSLPGPRIRIWDTQRLRVWIPTLSAEKAERMGHPAFYGSR